MNDFDWESQLLEENKTLRQIISDMADEDSANALKYQKLRDSVDKSIEEIADMQSHIQSKDEATDQYWVFVDKFDVLDILKRNIGE